MDMMTLHARIIRGLATTALIVSAGSTALAATDVAPAGAPDLTVTPHVGAQAIDISGHAPAGSGLSIALVATFSKDVPDVVVNRKTVAADANGAFATTIPIAPAYFARSLLTVYVKPAGSGPTLKATFSPEAPNRGAVVPADQVPRAVR